MEKYIRCWNNVVSIATSSWVGWLRNCGSIPRRCKRYFSISKRPYQLCTHLATCLVCMGGCSLMLKWLGHEADRLSLSSVEVKNEWSCTIQSPTCLKGLHRDNLALPWEECLKIQYFKCCFPKNGFGTNLISHIQHRINSLLHEL